MVPGLGDAETSARVVMMVSGVFVTILSSCAIIPAWEKSLSKGLPHIKFSWKGFTLGRSTGSDVQAGEKPPESRWRSYLSVHFARWLEQQYERR